MEKFKKYLHDNPEVEAVLYVIALEATSMCIGFAMGKARPSKLVKAQWATAGTYGTVEWLVKHSSTEVADAIIHTMETTVPEFKNPALFMKAMKKVL